MDVRLAAGRLCRVVIGQFADDSWHNGPRPAIERILAARSDLGTPPLLPYA